MSCFELPDLRIETLGLPEEKELLVLGGEPPDPLWLQKNAALFTKTWAVDAGVEICYQCGLCPDYLVGDCDSASSAVWDWAEGAGAQIHLYARKKAATDFQLALDLIVNSGEPEGKQKAVFITGCFGGRMDHLMSNVSSLLYWRRELIPVGMADQRQGLLIVNKNTGEKSLSFRYPPKALSLLPLSAACKGVSLEGVLWPLDKVNLTADKLWTVSNEVLFDQTQTDWSSHVKVSCENGNLGVYWFW